MKKEKRKKKETQFHRKWQFVLDNKRNTGMDFVFNRQESIP
jgi:hypothetical protein